MTGSNKRQNSTWDQFSKRTTLHGVKEFYDASLLGKIFWGSLAVVAVCVVLVQLEGAIEKFVREETGVSIKEIESNGKSEEWGSDRIPSVYLCPDAWVDFNLINQSLGGRFNRETLKKVVTVINGFFTLKGIEQLSEIDATTADIFERVKQFYGGEALNVAMELYSMANGSLEQLVNMIGLQKPTKVSAMNVPSFLKLREGRIVTMNGACFTYSGNSTINSVQAGLNAGIKVYFHILSENGLFPDFLDWNTRGKHHFRVLLTHPDVIDLNAVTDATLSYGTQYVLLYSVTSLIRQNLRRAPCRKYNQGDHSHCVHEYGNRIRHGTGDWTGCQTPIPRSSRFPEQRVDAPCNTFLAPLQSAFFEYSRLEYSSSGFARICPRPCTVMQYQYTFVEKKKTDVGSFIEIRPAAGISGMEIKEFLVLDSEGMLANVGGVLGLWLGASLISIIQMIYIFGTNCGTGRKDRIQALDSAVVKKSVN